MTPKQRSTAHMLHARQRAVNIQGILSKYRAIRHLTDSRIAAAAGIKLPTYYKRKADPSTFKIGELWRLYDVLEVPEDERKTVM